MSEFQVPPVGHQEPVSEVQRPARGENTGFADALKEAIKEVNELQNQSGEEIERLSKGELNDVHSAMLALQKADLSFQLMMQVRNKLVQAYRDIMRMQG